VFYEYRTQAQSEDDMFGVALRLAALTVLVFVLMISGVLF
jgi:hypothetical protein